MVKLIHTTTELITERNSETGMVGFVPTMGNLHKGHISLLDQALSEFDIVYFSIFVNPKQFGPNEDFNRYPRTLEADVNQLRTAVNKHSGKKVVVYSPHNPAEVFPPEKNQTISVYGLSSILEGKIRPGHFDGVTTVVHRLFELVRPQKAWFGLKDYQQYIVIKQMVKDLVMPVKIQGMPIIREESGLALSSRNQYLTPDQKRDSLILFNTLNEVKALIAGKKDNTAKARSYIDQVLRDKNWNYLELRDSETLSEDISFSNTITILAVYQLGATRLLDNMQVEVQ
ncbi:MAG: pantoate--beta-alanine ligase [Bacteriovoracia bacterium]